MRRPPKEGTMSYGATESPSAPVPTSGGVRGAGGGDGKCGRGFSMLELRLRFFGVPEIGLGGRPVTLRRRSALALLAYLAVTGRPHRRETLATLLSDDLGGEQAGRLLCNALYELRGLIGDHLVVTPKEVGLRPDAPRWQDVAVFRSSLEAALEAEEG